MKRSTFYIAELCCPTEEHMIRNRLKRLPQVEELDFNLLRRELTITHDSDDVESVVEALRSIGMRPQTPATSTSQAQAASLASSCCNSCSDGGEDIHAHSHDAHTHDGHTHGAVSHRQKWALALSGLAAGGSEVLSWLWHAEHSPLVIGLALLAIVTGGAGPLRKGWQALRSGTFNIDLLTMIAVLGAVCIGHWPEAAMVTFLFGLAELIESYSLERARHAVQSLVQMAPETAIVRDDSGQWQTRAASSVAIGETVRVQAGERVPLDGTVTFGRSSVNQAPITGESVPVEKQIGDTLFAGTVNGEGALEFQTTHAHDQSTLARIVRSVQEAQSGRAPTQRFIDEFARYYTPAVMVLAALTAAVPPLFFGSDWQFWFYNALVMLVIACPCALVISTPVTVVSGLAVAARLGILVKGGVFLEQGRLLRAIALDKTGTLTQGCPVVTDFVTQGNIAEAEVLRIAASLETLTTHPVAQSIVALQQQRAAAPLQPVDEFQLLPGSGISGTIEGTKYFIGAPRAAAETLLQPVQALVEQWENEQKTVVVISDNSQVLALFGITDTLRDSSLKAVRALQKRGVHLVMLTGDNPTTAQRIAEQTGIREVHAALLPQDKLATMDQLLLQHGKVGMVGDGVNDAPALARASLGFAMGAAGSDTAIETADVALMQDDLRKLPVFMDLSHATAALLKQNIALSIGIKVLFFALALSGNATLWMAVFADIGATLIVISNALRLLRFSPSTD
jgi:Cd2+/Zn2+-exporting ATPase